ncbi:outer membrane lipoprotein carrier protein LolA [Vibrio rumoiensis]|uniref:Outer membrane lipoprotein carrier protein LolA n=1 Tax=Vibrio rumoiensis 1S-45 TaxID=1188252 RepID=A0A1E5E2N1_9VIBR|nr:outer membrane lipoprotein carrier protein LolA [Vibrio rumoiensis]OEF25446.1 hypothetical protein A1QC_08720 [Vibrio rumoiensis 1S-45]
MHKSWIKRDWKTTVGMIFLVCAIMFIAKPSQATSINLEQLQQQLSNHPIVRGDFVQTRHMKMFDAPLQSSGTFLLSSQHGLWWQQTSPFPTSLILTQDKLSQRIGDQPAQILKVRDNPMVFYFSHVFLSLFQGDTNALTEQFELKLTQESANSPWQLQLTPKAAPLNKVFNSITVSGKDYINHVELNEVRGDKSIIDFTHQQSAPETLSTAEKEAFNF